LQKTEIDKKTLDSRVEERRDNYRSHADRRDYDKREDHREYGRRDYEYGQHDFRGGRGGYNRQQHYDQWDHGHDSYRLVVLIPAGGNSFKLVTMIGDTYLRMTLQAVDLHFLAEVSNFKFLKSP
jgi:hypothetical protein